MCLSPSLDKPVRFTRKWRKLFYLWQPRHLWTIYLPSQLLEDIEAERVYKFFCQEPLGMGLVDSCVLICEINLPSECFVQEANLIITKTRQYL